MMRILIVISLLLSILQTLDTQTLNFSSISIEVFLEGISILWEIAVITHACSRQFKLRPFLAQNRALKTAMMGMQTKIWTE